MKELSKKWRILFLFLPLIMISYYGCKKDLLQSVSDKHNVIEIEEIKTRFKEENIQSKLTQTIKGVGEIVWLPDWDKVTQISQDSSVFNYIKLYPQTKDRKSKRTVSATNFKKYLIIKNRQEFQKATYIKKVKNTDDANDKFSLKDFNGTLLLENLNDGSKINYPFVNGKFQRKMMNNKKLLSNQKPGTTSYWDYQCTTVYYCEFYAFCDYGVALYFDGSGDCSPPGWPPSHDLGSDCFDNFWTQSWADAVTECDHIWVDNPPPSPDGDGQGGGEEIPFPEDPCKEKMNIKNRQQNATIDSLNDVIRGKNDGNEWGANQNLQSLSMSSGYKNTVVETDGLTDRVALGFSWNATDGYSIGSTHNHPEGNIQSPPDVFKIISNLSQPGLLAGGNSDINFYKMYVSSTVVTDSGTYVVTIKDWTKLSQKFTSWINDPSDIEDQYSDIRLLYFAQYPNATNEEASALALLAVLGDAINLYQAEPGSTNFVPLEGGVSQGQYILRDKECP